MEKRGVQIGVLLLAGAAALLTTSCNREAPKEEGAAKQAAAPARVAPFDTATADAVLAEPLEAPQTKPIRDAAAPETARG